MSADFWAGYISGAIGIVIGNPLDILKVRLQAGGSSSSTSSPISSSPSLPSPTPGSTPSTGTASAATTNWIRPFLRGTAAPVLGYGALNALLFVSYNRTESALNQFVFGIDPSLPSQIGVNLWSTWIAGAVGGLATWVVSTPTELVKCRVQLQDQGVVDGENRIGREKGSWQVTKHVLRTQGIKGLYFGGVVTALRDSIGYGFYFWSYELSSRWMVAASSSSSSSSQAGGIFTSEAARVLLCGGLAGIVTWASIFPLDVIKTRVQTQGILGVGASSTSTEQTTLLDQTTTAQRKQRPLGAWEVAKSTYREGGVKPFFRGLAVCSVRAFIVNAVQWAIYEWIMTELGQGRRAKASAAGVEAGSSFGGGELVGMGA
ncbi:mitochondrial carrier domain-containing protein [Pseudoneurospora amorphoporcata]|uniref:Mitochondrial carrier domain-containing protein n=1 Tax=Pseudoneurospora amorphoporcata TaxID=241081 RepID=A0AAN6NZF8_9PEZI|nr:mitochondrial carrier domain-containing protein [Pseudoneurospora amorphoporcata]